MSDNGNLPAQVSLDFKTSRPIEVGETCQVEVKCAIPFILRPTWLGTVRDGKELARAMRLMAEIDDERAVTNGLT